MTSDDRCAQAPLFLAAALTLFLIQAPSVHSSEPEIPTTREGLVSFLEKAASDDAFLAEIEGTYKLPGTVYMPEKQINFMTITDGVLWLSSEDPATKQYYFTAFKSGLDEIHSVSTLGELLDFFPEENKELLLEKLTNLDIVVPYLESSGAHTLGLNFSCLFRSNLTLVSINIVLKQGEGQLENVGLRSISDSGIMQLKTLSGNVLMSVDHFK